MKSAGSNWEFACRKISKRKEPKHKSMNQFEQYKRLIKLGFALILVALLTGLYGVIWINWYNKIIWAPFFRRGNWMMIFIYGLLLIFFMQLYGGFKIALLKRGNLIY